MRQDKFDQVYYFTVLNFAHSKSQFQCERPNCDIFSRGTCMLYNFRAIYYTSFGMVVAMIVVFFIFTFIAMGEREPDLESNFRGLVDGFPFMINYTVECQYFNYAIIIKKRFCLLNKHLSTLLGRHVSHNDGKSISNLFPAHSINYF